MLRTVTALLALASLAACEAEPPADEILETGAAPVAAPAPAETPSSDAATPGLAIEAEGLRLFNADTGAARPIAFGTTRDAALAAMGFRGAPETGTNEECGAGPLQFAMWPDGLTLWFQDDAFAGWAIDDRSKGTITTASGIGPGSTRTELDAAYAADVSQTTLGTEFAAGELYGIINGDAATDKVVNMWAGVSCNFR